MRINQVVLTFILAIQVGCTEPSTKNVQAVKNGTSVLSEAVADSLKQEANWKAFEESFKLEDYLLSSIPTSDFIEISEKSGIFISPDSVQIENLKKENGEEDFYTVADDNMYFQYEASEFLNKKHFKIIYPTKRYIKFISKKKEFYFDTKSKSAIGWTTILFSPEKDAPKIINSAEIELEYQEYIK